MFYLDHDHFSFLYDHGDHVVALVDLRSSRMDRGDEVGLGEDGDEGIYIVHQMLPLDRAAFAELDEPAALVLVNPHVGPPI